MIIATGTASGKTLAYLVPALTAILEGGTVLYLTPTKALAADQLRAVQALDVPGVRSACFDGDTPFEERVWIRQHANYVLTNPDMVHRTLLPRHAQWTTFWRRLRMIVVDESHSYRGVFGSHVAQILRRLRRVTAKYGSRPVFMLASATSGDPGLAAGRLIGLETAEVTTDTSPRGATTFALWEPPLTDLRGEGGAPVRRTATAEAADLLADLVASDIRTLAFIRSRRGAETVALTARTKLADLSSTTFTPFTSPGGGHHVPQPTPARDASGYVGPAGPAGPVSTVGPAPTDAGPLSAPPGGHGTPDTGVFSTPGAEPLGAANAGPLSTPPSDTGFHSTPPTDTSPHSRPEPEPHSPTDAGPLSTPPTETGPHSGPDPEPHSPADAGPLSTPPTFTSPHCTPHHDTTIEADAPARAPVPAPAPGVPLARRPDSSPSDDDCLALLPSKVAAYRGGYLAEERRALEKAFRSGALVGLATTNALELGVDITGLDAVLIAGWPGTRASLWQQAGRAGRAGQDALAVLIARDDPLDTYLVHHPEALFGRPVESIVLDPDNPYVLAPHLCAAAAEIPLTEQDLDIFGPAAPGLLEDLVAQGLLRQRSSGWYWTSRDRATDLADIRGGGGRLIQLVEHDTGRLLGTVDESSAHTSVHTGAVYMHQGESFLVEELDLDTDVALLSSEQPDYSTYARDVTEITVLGTIRSHPLGSGTLHFGEVEVTRQVVSYIKRRLQTGELMGDEQLDLPPRTLRTRAVWWTLPSAEVTTLAETGLDLGGAAHAAEHAAIGLLPLFATCDRWDIGGVSTELHPDTGLLTVFVYDGHQGGAGFAERGYARASDWLRATREAIASCECDRGCPSCIQSPKCGNGNDPLDKAGAIRLLDTLLS
ncbi:DEAD/DEAH box helicase [Sinosporangium siamense]|uniref:DEAD/DEAH box helicase n=1 Tax=Sinosporangium siamense TaxID=1367973 RepID=UPI001EF23F8B